MICSESFFHFVCLFPYNSVTSLPITKTNTCASGHQYLVADINKGVSGINSLHSCCGSGINLLNSCCKHNFR